MFDVCQANNDMGENNFKIIFERIRGHLNAKSEADVARGLGVSPQALFTFKKKGKFPSDLLIKYCLKHQISVDWLLTGEGEMYRKVPAMIAEGLPPYGLSKDVERLIREISEHLTRLNFEFLSTDVWMARVLEELIDILLYKGIIHLTDLPPIVREKIKLRKNLRDHEMPGKK